MSSRIRVTREQLATLRRIGEEEMQLSSEPNAAGYGARPFPRTTLHERLSSMGLIERLYVDPRHPAQKMTETQARASELELEVYMRWHPRWVLTEAGREVLGMRRRTQDPRLLTSAHRLKFESMQFSPNETSLILRFSGATIGPGGRPSEAAAPATSVCLPIRHDETLAETMERARAMVDEDQIGC